MSYLEVFLIFVSLLIGLLVGYLMGTYRRPDTSTPTQDIPEVTGRDMALLSQNLRQLEGRVQDLTSRTNQHLGSLGQQLRASAEGERRLAQATQDLKSMLSSRTARGAWGEIELQRIFEAAGLMQHVDFALQSIQSNQSRPDAIIYLPEGGAIAIDAKVPLDAYLRAMSVPAESAEYADLMRIHARTLAEHVKTLEKRNYHGNIEGSLGFTLMFLPIEALLSAALDVEPALLETSIKSNVFIVTPTSLLATARTCAQIWVLAKTEDTARDVIKVGSELSSRLKTTVSHLNKVGAGLQSALKAYNQTIGSLETRVLPQLRKIEGIDSIQTSKSIEDTTVRNFSAPEWTD